ncbi:hypothetical protein HQ545_02290, partial [Candidatus Woesearchaeota archaeon]|nr:hypothetical protein [Candidatus Woesearchaeota archaeon]
SGTQTRVTVCDGGCSDWFACSVSDTESECTDSADNDCDLLTDCADPDCSSDSACIDADSDGFSLDDDCDDSNPSINPVASELCNARDDNCDGQIDNGITRECGVSNTGVCQLGIENCVFGSWIGCDAILPTSEVCDTIDNNCDGDIDEGCSCTTGTTRSCGSDTGRCETGTQTCMVGLWSDCLGEVLSVDEFCGNFIDDDCDGEVDELCEIAPPTPKPLPTPEIPESIVTPPTLSPPDTSSILTRPCIDTDGDSFGIDCPTGFDCDDFDASVNPGAEEVCDSIDNNCNAIIDEHISRECGASDIGRCRIGSERCIAGAWSACTAILPRDEICGNLVDDDCDGSADENCERDFSDEELALREFVDLWGRDVDDYLNSYRKNKEYITIRKSSEIINGRTRIYMSISPLENLKNVTVFEYVPKTLSSSAVDIIFSRPPVIIQEDPLFAWHFDDVYSGEDINYDIDGEYEDAHLDTKTIAVVGSVTGSSWYFNILPLLAIPILGFVLIFVVQMMHKRRS